MGIMTGEQLGGTDLPIWYDVSQTKSGTNGVPNEGNVGRGTIYLKEGLSHSKWDGWTVWISCFLSAPKTDAGWRLEMVV